MSRTRAGLCALAALTLAGCPHAAVEVASPAAQVQDAGRRRAQSGDDSNDAIHPGRPEVCDGLSNDCDPGTPDGADDCRDGWEYCALGARQCDLR